jgi:integrase-like protein
MGRKLLAVLLVTGALVAGAALPAAAEIQAVQFRGPVEAGQTLELRCPDGYRVQRSGLPYIRFHDLRHTYATLQLQAGVHPKGVSEALGHANIGITLDTYSHATPSMLEQAAETIAATIWGS